MPPSWSFPNGACPNIPETEAIVNPNTDVLLRRVQKMDINVARKNLSPLHRRPFSRPGTKPGNVLA